MVDTQDRLRVLYIRTQGEIYNLPSLATQVGLGGDAGVLLAYCAGDFIHTEATLSGATLNFMSSRMTMGMSQVIFGHTHVTGHTLGT